MNTITVKLKLPNPLTLPVNYNHALQGVIYQLLSTDSVLSDKVHNLGAEHNNRKYKLFTFSNLNGKKIIENKLITFYDTVSFALRSVDKYFIATIISALTNANFISLGVENIEISEVSILKKEISANRLRIKMLSPITVHTTDEKGKTTYYSPFDNDFLIHINNNFKRKYEAFYGEAPKSEVALKVLRVNDRDKCVTTFKGIYITATYGEYLLEGEAKYLEFLYCVGLGARNSQGFGMFETI
jgi:CRISPR-associated endoribonuclease Cas6